MPLNSPCVIEEEGAYSTSGAWLQPQSPICKYRDLFLAHCKPHQLQCISDILSGGQHGCLAHPVTQTEMTLTRVMHLTWRSDSHLEIKNRAFNAMMRCNISGNAISEGIEVFTHPFLHAPCPPGKHWHTQDCPST
jgi:hypothetical protein